MYVPQHRSVWARALNRSAIRALLVGVSQNRDLLRVFWCWVCAVGRGDFASVSRGHSDVHSTIDTDDGPSCAHDRGYERAHSWVCIADQPPSRLQEVFRVVGSVTRGLCHVNSVEPK